MTETLARPVRLATCQRCGGETIAPRRWCSACKGALTHERDTAARREAPWQTVERNIRRRRRRSDGSWVGLYVIDALHEGERIYGSFATLEEAREALREAGK